MGGIHRFFSLLFCGERAKWLKCLQLQTSFVRASNVVADFSGLENELQLAIPPQEPSDHSLLRRFRSGEQDAATRLYVRYAKRLHGLATAQTGSDLKARLDPEDIVQSIFRTFFRRAQEGHYDVPDGEELWKLFLVIGLHKIRDAATFHRAGKRNVDRTIGMSFDSGHFDPAAPDDFAEKTLRMVIDDLLKSLSENQREIIMQRLDGAQVEEIAARTQRSLRTVERTLQKFRELLRQHIDETLGGDESTTVA